jgi:hypothetical protein
MRSSAIYPSIASAEGKFERGPYEYTFLDRLGKRVLGVHVVTNTSDYYVTPECIYKDSIVYWSSKDQSLCVVKTINKLKWISLSSVFHNNEIVCRMTSTNNGIYLLIKNFNQFRVLYLNPETGVMRWLKNDIVDVRGHEDSSNVAWMLKDNQFHIRYSNYNSDRIISEKIRAWDSDPQLQVTCYLRNNDYYNIYILNRNKKIVFHAIGDTQDIYFCPKFHVIWVTNYCMFFPITFISVYDYSGHFMGYGSPDTHRQAPLYLYDHNVANIISYRR